MHFTLRPFRPSDADALVKYANNPNIARFMTDGFPHPFTLERAQGFIRMTGSADPIRIRAIEIEGEIAGAIGIHPQEDIMCKNAELGYWLAEPFWGKGVMTHAIRETVDYGFQNWEIDRIFARPFGSNIGSQRALEKAGFVLEAKFEKTIFKNGNYEDEWVYAVRR
jgi:RimJ/RimL family protein N-acetyltransferase